VLGDAMSADDLGLVAMEKLGAVMRERDALKAQRDLAIDALSYAMARTRDDVIEAPMSLARTHAESHNALKARCERLVDLLRKADLAVTEAAERACAQPSHDTGLAAHLELARRAIRAELDAIDKENAT